jgi:hypothetical protein
MENKEKKHDKSKGSSKNEKRSSKSKFNSIK